jgi:hypothetical protein
MSMTHDDLTRIVADILGNAPPELNRDARAAIIARAVAESCLNEALSRLPEIEDDCTCHLVRCHWEVAHLRDELLGVDPKADLLAPQSEEKPC